MSQERQQCLNCSAPAVPGGGTLPLCARCKALAEGNKRGVNHGKSQQQNQPREKQATV